MNTTWFWFEDETDRRRLHGTPQDAMRKFELLTSCLGDLSGLEIFLMPERLTSEAEFSDTFYREFSRLPYRTVHIGSSNQDFLCSSADIGEKLSILAAMMNRLECDRIIIHSDHFIRSREQIKELFASQLPEVEVCIENTGFGVEWGGRASHLKEIFNDCPDYTFCIDIAHVRDLGISLSEFIDDSDIYSRLREVHFSYSTFSRRTLGVDMYEELGFPGYDPYHALFSVVQKPLSERTKEIVCNFPIVLEGIIPREDREMNFLRQEIELLA